VNLLIKEKTE